MVAHLMYSGALDELKKLKILLPHGGGYVPYQIGRFIHGFNVRPEPKMKTKTSPADLLRRFYFDALTHDPQAARHLINSVGADHVVIGSDHPFDMGAARPHGRDRRDTGLDRERARVRLQPDGAFAARRRLTYRVVLARRVCT